MQKRKVILLFWLVTGVVSAYGFMGWRVPGCMPDEPYILACPYEVALNHLNPELNVLNYSNFGDAPGAAVILFFAIVVPILGWSFSSLLALPIAVLLAACQLFPSFHSWCQRKFQPIAWVIGGDKPS